MDAPHVRPHRAFGSRAVGCAREPANPERASSDGPLSLKCQSPNLRAQDFYLREGFRIVDVGRDPGAAFTWLRMSR